MSVQRSATFLSGLVATTEARDFQEESTVVLSSEKTELFMEKISQGCRPESHYEDALEALHKLNVPFKYQLLTRGVQAYVIAEGPKVTSEKIVRLLADRGYLYHASLLASLQKDNRQLVESLCVPIFSSLERYGECSEIVIDLKKNIENIVKYLNFLLLKGYLNEVVALIPFIESPISHNTVSTEVIKRLCYAKRIDEAIVVLSQMYGGILKSTDQPTLFIIEALAKSGDLKEAMRFTSGLEKPCFVDQAKVSILSILAKAGRFEEAIVLFDQLLDKKEQVFAAIPLLRALLDASQLDPSYLDVAMETLSKVTDHSNSQIEDRSSSLTDNKMTLCDLRRDLVQALVNVDRLEEAKGIFNSTLGEKEQASVGFPIVRKLLDMGREEEVNALVTESTNVLFQDKSMALLIKGLMQKAFLKMAEVDIPVTLIKEAKEKIKFLTKKAEVEGRIEEVMDEANAILARATAVAHSLEVEVGPRVQSLKESALEFIKGATALLGKLTNPDEKTSSLCLIMQGFVKMGMLDVALSLFKASASSVNHAGLYTVLRESFVSLIKEDRMREAENLLTQITGRTQSMLGILVMKAWLAKGGPQDALGTLDLIPREGRFIKSEINKNYIELGHVKLEIVEKLIRENTGVSFNQVCMLLDEIDVRPFFYVPVVRSFMEIGCMTSALNYLGGCLVKYEEQDLFTEVTVEIIKELAKEWKLREFESVIPLIKDVALQKKVMMTFEELGEKNRLIDTLKVFLKVEENQSSLAEVTVEVIKELAEKMYISEIESITSLIRDENLLEKVAPIVKQVKSEMLCGAVQMQAELIAKEVTHSARLKINGIVIEAQNATEEW